VDEEEEEEAGKGALKENVDDAGSLFAGCWSSAGGVGRLAICLFLYPEK
jgi:hypothetical protein